MRPAFLMKYFKNTVLAIAILLFCSKPLIHPFFHACHNEHGRFEIASEPLNHAHKTRIAHHIKHIECVICASVTTTGELQPATIFTSFHFSHSPFVDIRDGLSPRQIKLSYLSRAPPAWLFY